MQLPSAEAQAAMDSRVKTLEAELKELKALLKAAGIGSAGVAAAPRHWVRAIRTSVQRHGLLNWLGFKSLELGKDDALDGSQRTQYCAGFVLRRATWGRVNSPQAQAILALASLGVAALAIELWVVRA
jgi:hypothetical protein